MAICKLEKFKGDFEAQDKKNKGLKRRCITGISIYARQFHLQYGIKASEKKVEEIRRFLHKDGRKEQHPKWMLLLGLIAAMAYAGS